MRFTFDEICESQDFEHDAEFVRYEFYCELEARNKELEELIKDSINLLRFSANLIGRNEYIEKAKKLLRKNDK